MKISLISLNAYSSSLGIRHLSSALKEKGHAVKAIFLFPANIKEFYPQLLPDKLLRELKELVSDSELIGISCFSSEAKEAIRVIKYLKGLNKPIVWGGVYATSLPDKCIKYADIVCIGEGEEAICELAERMENKLPYLDTKNFWFKADNRVIKNPVRPLIHDLDSLPTQDYGPLDNYVREGGGLIPASQSRYFRYPSELVLFTIRGCPYKCTFCYNSFARALYLDKGPYVRKMSIQNVITQLKQLKDRFPKVRHVWFVDDCFFVRTVEELFLFSKEYKEKINLPFRVFLHPRYVTEEKLILALAAGGLSSIDVGVQTGSESFNRNLYKRFVSNEEILRAAKLINKFAGKMEAPPRYEFIYHNPYETEKDLLATIALIQKLPPPCTIHAFPLQFFEATELYKKAKEDGLLKKKIISLHDYRQAFRQINSNGLYLNFLIFLLGEYDGVVTRYQIGCVPRYLLPILTSRKAINYYKRHRKELAALIDDYFRLANAVDYLKETGNKYRVFNKFILHAIKHFA